MKHKNEETRIEKIISEIENAGNEYGEIGLNQSYKNLVINMIFYHIIKIYVANNITVRKNDVILVTSFDKVGYPHQRLKARGIQLIGLGPRK